MEGRAQFDEASARWTSPGGAFYLDAGSPRRMLTKRSELRQIVFSYPLLPEHKRIIRDLTELTPMDSLRRGHRPYLNAHLHLRAQQPKLYPPVALILRGLARSELAAESLVIVDQKWRSRMGLIGGASCSRYFGIFPLFGGRSPGTTSTPSPQFFDADRIAFITIQNKQSFGRGHSPYPF